MLSMPWRFQASGEERGGENVTNRQELQKKRYATGTLSNHCRINPRPPPGTAGCLPINAFEQVLGYLMRSYE